MNGRIFPDIYLKSGGLIDPVDKDLIDSLGWSIHESRPGLAYARLRRNGGKRFYLHRLIASRILKRELKKLEIIDHVNGNGLDNRRSNIRICTNAENIRNRKGPQVNGKSGVLGVCFCKQTGKWSTEIRLNGEKIWLGRHEKKEDAIAARVNAEKKYWGKFAPVKKG